MNERGTHVPAGPPINGGCGFEAGPAKAETGEPGGFSRPTPAAHDDGDGSPRPPRIDEPKAPHIDPVSPPRIDEPIKPPISPPTRPSVEPGKPSPGVTPTQNR